MKAFLLKKEKLSIRAIGYRRFWMGLLIGIITAIFLAYFLNVLWKTFRLFDLTTNRSTDYPPEKTFIDSLFTGLFASVLGLTLSVWIWMNGQKKLSKRRFFYAKISASHSLFLFWLYTFVFFDFWKLAAQEYQIHFDAETIRMLKEFDTYRSRKQVSKLRRMFKDTAKVSLENIILEKIIVHNTKKALVDSYYISTWHFASPDNIYQQLKFYNPEDPEAKELMLLLKEQIDFRNFPGVDSEERIPEIELPEFNHAAIVDSIRADEKYEALLEKYIVASEVDKLRKNNN